ncbi:hypothetical protein F5148DRAFT_423904 [Russula earlei]|uniref:Uncharacterized protein n=1 Tax=Russula earlei TaxID=71964 RepID=A0ACC0TZ79_9AGAM|nr:hypothetical protein F5148DRAFT_423904 [Russula earlei]
MLNPSQSQHAPSKSSLTITLTEPLVILRTADTSGAAPSVLRGLLALDLSKASRISSIEVELQASSCASWTEGLGTTEVRKIFGATQVFFRAASCARRSLSVDPGVSHYTNENENGHPPTTPPEAEIDPAPPALPVPPPVHANDVNERGRMRVRRRSSADHLVFQRDPVAHLNRPAAPSPLSFPPTTEEEVTTQTPTLVQFVDSPSASVSSFPPVGTPSPAHIHARRNLAHSRAASLGDTQTPRSSNHPGRSTIASPAPDCSTGKGHRSHPSLSLGSIFGRGSHPSSPVHEEGRPQSPQSAGRERGREKGSVKRHPLLPSHALGRVGEEERKEVGDGWQEFRKGTYTFPIFFEIPSHMPASLECNGGSVSWKLVAKAQRPGVFTSNLTATREVQVVSIPAEVDAEMIGDVVIERPWEDQLQYLFKVSKKVFTIGGSFDIKMIFMPLAKIRLYKLAVDIEERVNSYVGGVNMTRTVNTVIHLISLQNDDETKPLLPLSSRDPLAYENSPLAALRPLGANPSEQVSQLLGPGPWPVRAKLYLPADCDVLHATSRSRESSVHVTHALRFTMRISRGDDAGVDPKTGKTKLFEIVVRTPVHILSCYARAEYTALPRYSETLDDSARVTPSTPDCPCEAERQRRARRRGTGGERTVVEASPMLPAAPFGATRDELLERTLEYERLVSGHEGALGDAPPAYEPGPGPGPAHSLHPTVIAV